jgi:corrinoid protein of di/trimethylamine methyltransferase
MSSEEEILKRLRDCVVTFDSENVPKACEDALAAGIPAYEAIANGLSRGMEIVGQKYEAKECFLADLIMAGETMKEGMKILKPHLGTGDLSAMGTVVIGTVKGDLHDIGKDIIATLLEAAGFQVVDLGVDVSAEEFVRAVGNHKADILGMSALLTTTMPEMQLVIRELEKAGLRGQLNVIIGGAAISPEYAREIGADAVGKDAVDGVNICKTWSGSTR